MDSHDKFRQILNSPRRAPLKVRRASSISFHPKEKAVADDKSNTGNPDWQRINTSQEHELRDWAQKFGASQEELKSAVAQVGNQADAVREHLKGRSKRA